ncbi:sulfite exporter TauE/SafE family protein [Oceanicella sp. SM1341]|uniref:sulfite exporter TauE/SafE family protein n=1 Tax=Oceanicella sp. SM1341 TaxID=1548889 RepID=UPI001E593129|nr:sulfite exporter TauE/SafE family protein [Oceanicella sp. SM1341]
MLSLGTLALIAVATFLAAVLRGITGFGFAMAAVPMIGLVLPPERAIPIAILLQCLVGVRDCVAMRHQVHRGSVAMLSAGALVGTPFGLAVLDRADPATMRVLIALIVSAALVFLVRKPALPVMGGRRVALPAGFLSGLFSGIAAMPGPPAVAYYLSAPTPPATARASLMVFFFITSLFALPGLAWQGRIDREALIETAVALPCLLAGTALGAWIFRRTSDRGYRAAALGMLGVMAAATGVKGVLELL